MPSIDLTRGPQTLARYDVLGEYAERHPRFVKHVGLHDAADGSAQAGDAVSAVHMRPPLEHGEKLDVHVAGRVPLTADEIKAVSAWIEEIADEYRAAGAVTKRQYVIHPPWEDVTDPNTNTRRYRRYSCAGFVLDAHRQAGIELLAIDEAALPKVDRTTIERAYPLVARRRPGVLSQFGLKGHGPWKVVLAGYVLHSLDRPTDRIHQEPYQARPGDELF